MDPRWLYSDPRWLVHGCTVILAGWCMATSAPGVYSSLAVQWLYGVPWLATLRQGYSSLAVRCTPGWLPAGWLAACLLAGAWLPAGWLATYLRSPCLING